MNYQDYQDVISDIVEDVKDIKEYSEYTYKNNQDENILNFAYDVVHISYNLVKLLESPLTEKVKSEFKKTASDLEELNKEGLGIVKHYDNCGK